MPCRAQRQLSARHSELPDPDSGRSPPSVKLASGACLGLPVIGGQVADYLKKEALILIEQKTQLVACADLAHSPISAVLFHLQPTFTCQLLKNLAYTVFAGVEGKMEVLHASSLAPIAR